MEEIITNIGQVVALVSGIGALAIAISTKRKTDAEAKKVDVEAKSTEVRTALETIRMLNEQLDRQSARITELERKDEAKDIRINGLEAESESQSNRIEFLNGYVLKIKMAYGVNERQLIFLNEKPLLPLDKAEQMTVDEVIEVVRRQMHREAKSDR